MTSSTYILEVCDHSSGGVSELHTTTDSAELERILEAFVDSQSAAAHSILSTMTLGIWVVQRGEVKSFIDLHEFIWARLEDDQLLSLEELHQQGEANSPLFQALSELNEEDDIEDIVQLEVWWEAISKQLPVLEEPVLKRGEVLRFRNTTPPGTPSSNVDALLYLKIGSITDGDFRRHETLTLPPPPPVEFPGTEVIELEGHRLVRFISPDIDARVLTSLITHDLSWMKADEAKNDGLSDETTWLRGLIAHGVNGFLLPVSYFSELFLDGVPLDKATFLSKSTESSESPGVRILDVTIPRVGDAKLFVHGAVKLVTSALNVSATAVLPYLAL